MPSISKMFSAKDMTTGRPMVKIAQFAAPLLVGNIAQQLYNTADSVIVGKYVGDNALAAVGGSMPVLNILMVLFVGVATGAGITVSQYFGAKRREELADTVGTCIMLTFFGSLAMMALGYLIAGPMLRAIKTPDAIYGMCLTYLRIFFLGALGFAFYNILAGILRGLGDSLSALKYLLIAAALNVVLDLIFVAYFHMGVAGVAIATAIAQAISAMLTARKLFSMRDVMHLSRKNLHFHKDIVRQIIKLGLPSGAAQAVMSMSFLLVQSLTNSFGEMFVACNTVVMRIDGFAMMPNFSFGNAMTSFTGQNVGANRMDRVDQGVKDGLKLSVGVAIITSSCIVLFGRFLASAFTDTPALVEMCVSMIRIIAVGYIAFAVTQTLGGTMRGAGDTVTPMWLSLIITLGLRLPLAYTFTYLSRTPENPAGRPETIFISLLVAWILGAIINAVAFKKGGWRRKAKARIDVLYGEGAYEAALKGEWQRPGQTEAPQTLPDVADFGEGE